MSGRVVVVGAGIAGTAAALAARAEHADVTVVSIAAGATVLTTGAIDDAPWEDGRPATALDDASRAVLDALGGYVVRDARALVATTAGTLRPARGADASLLDLATLPRKSLVGCPVFERESWDGHRLARSLAQTREARDGELGFVAVPASLLVHADERVIPDVEIAARHDAGERLATLAERLREALRGTRCDAFLLPPWLGTTAPRAAELASAVGVPCGEIIGLPPSPAGFRFMHARDRALLAAGACRIEARVTAVVRTEAGLVAHVEGGEPLGATAVVLATGGLIGGGIAYAPSEALLATALPRHPQPAFVLTLDADVSLGVHGRPLVVPGSMFGVQPETITWPMHDSPILESVGVLTLGDLRAADVVFAAGDTLADHPRTFLDALASGALAGRGAARACFSGRASCPPADRAQARKRS